MSLFPLFVDLADKRVVVVGGGKVGRRKAAAASAAGAAVCVVDPMSSVAGLCEAGRLDPAGTRPASQRPASKSPDHISEPYRPEHLAGAHLVFACATPEVNARVVADATTRGIWVNSATDDGDVILPAVVKRGDLTIAVSTGGASPALARRIREKLETEFDDSFAAWVNLLAEMRPIVMASIPDPDRRRALLDDLADWRWLDRIRDNGVEAVRAAIRAFVAGGEPGA